jgi:magnesium-transporting ATPase (P-type)
VLQKGTFQPVLWKHVRVGDIVEMRDNELVRPSPKHTPALHPSGMFLRRPPHVCSLSCAFRQFPADLLLVSTDKDGTAYVETSNLDGESNLKVRKAPAALAGSKTAADLASLSIGIEYEGANDRLYTFEGNLHPEEGEAVPLDANAVMLRGSRLRNTDVCYGIVLYSGKQTKLAMNSVGAPSKMSRVERLINRCIIFMLVCMVVLVTISVTINLVLESSFYRYDVADELREGKFQDEGPDYAPISTGHYGGHWYMPVV